MVVEPAAFVEELRMQFRHRSQCSRRNAHTVRHVRDASVPARPHSCQRCLLSSSSPRVGRFRSAFEDVVMSRNGGDHTGDTDVTAFVSRASDRRTLYVDGDKAQHRSGHLLGRERRHAPLVLRGHAGTVVDACFDPAGRRLASLDAKISADYDTAFGDLVGDDRAEDPFEALRDKDLRDEVGDLLDILDPRERRIIAFRFGLSGGRERTLEEVGQKFGVTRERIRQLQNMALLKLRKALRKREELKSPEPQPA